MSSVSQAAAIASDLREETLLNLAQSKPLCHPLPASLRLHSHEYPTPPFLRELMGDVYRAMNHERFPAAPRRICRLYPRDHGKSETGDHVIPSWAALANPNVRIAIIMEAETQAKQKLSQCRTTINEYGQHFGISIDEDNRKNLTLSRTQTHAEPTISARGFDAQITGGHYDVVIFDDIVSWPSQRTETQREKKWTQFQDYSQNLGSAGETTYLVLGTRKHPQDLYNNLLNSPNWDVDSKQAISDYSIIENGEFSVTTTAGNTYRGSELHEFDTREETIIDISPDRRVETLWPDRWPLEALIDKLLSELHSADGSALVFRRENQNDPQTMQGQVLNADQLHFVPPEAMPNEGLRFYAGVDVALEKDPEKAATGDTDWWAVAVIAEHPSSNTAYLVDVRRRRGQTMSEAIDWINTRIDAVEGVHDTEVAKILVESNQAQRWLIQEARDHDMRFSRSSSSGSKEERIISMSSRFESGRIKVVDMTRREGSSKRWSSFVSEWVSFPSGDHDDRLDAVEIALRSISLENVSTSSHGMGDLPTGH